MARNGSGVYTPPATSVPVTPGTSIDSTKYNNLQADIAAAISASIANDGQTTILADLPMNSHKLTGLSAGSAAGDSVRFDEYTALTGVNAASGRSALTAAAAGANSDITSLTNLASINGGQVGGTRNRIINGAMRIDQRNNGASQSFPAAAYSIDRWYYGSNGATTTGQQIALANGQNRYRATGSASVTSILFGQRIEAKNSLQLAGGVATLQAKLSSSSLTSITWSAYYANSVDAFGTFGSPTRIAIASGSWAISSTEATYSTNISIPAAAITGINIEFTGGGLLAAQTFTAGDVQLESGSVATNFEHLTYCAELALCQRYLPCIRCTGSGINEWFASGLSATTTSLNALIPFNVTARTRPTGIAVNNAANFVCFCTSNAASSAIAFGNSSVAGAFAVATTTGLTAGGGGAIGFGAAATTVDYLLFTGCEL